MASDACPERKVEMSRLVSRATKVIRGGIGDGGVGVDWVEGSIEVGRERASARLGIETFGAYCPA